MKKSITFVISTVFQDAGDATRALELAKGIEKYKPKDIQPRIIFFSHGSRFEQKARDLGFEVYPVEPAMSGQGLYQDLKMTPKNFVGTLDLAKQLIAGEIKAYREIKPDIILHGFWPMAGPARRMLPEEIPGICFIPLPLTEAFFDAIPAVPEQAKLFYLLPPPLGLWLFRHIPKFIKKRIPFIRQTNIRRAACELGWKKEKLLNLFDLLKADIILVNDIPDYYGAAEFPPNLFFTGPLFAKSGNDEKIDAEILKIFCPENSRTKIFCTLSSAGTQTMLREVIKTFTYGKGLEWDAVILSPHYALDEARKLSGNREGIYITDKFVPAQKINAMADVVICHGGQGTVQTAMNSGTPLVGVAMQQEQFINLSNIAARGAGIRIPLAKWNSENIREAVNKIISDKAFKQAALKLQERMKKMDGEKNSAEIIWNFAASQKVLLQSYPIENQEIQNFVKP